MEKYAYAKHRVAGQDMLLVVLEREQAEELIRSGSYPQLQAAAQIAGLPGIVVPVWQFETGFRYMAPAPWEATMESMTWDEIVRSTEDFLHLESEGQAR
ncbi:hypothetical protein CEG14_14785 [Bordetella genomosp. 1]|uniref:Uncharacterized protein n=1 Tax=Bordetella genomosp. 1 TaxID=1395607 RepID=A0A261SGJ8_9BORD|nr:hypothetical protein CEG14_14785 [Bordetella genomosp. 1]